MTKLTANQTIEKAQELGMKIHVYGKGTPNTFYRIDYMDYGFNATAELSTDLSVAQIVYGEAELEDYVKVTIDELFDFIEGLNKAVKVLEIGNLRGW